MIYIDVKYADILGPRLRNFKRKSDFLWNFSCPVCGDSSKNLSKARGYIYQLPTKTGLGVKCHKCGYSTDIGKFIKYLDPNLYTEYTLENYKESGAPRSRHADTNLAVPSIIKSPELTDDILSSIKRIDQLPIYHPAVKYVQSRKISSKHWNLLYFAPRFMKFVNSVIPGKFREELLKEEHPRLVIPYFNTFGKCVAFQGRSFGDEKPKYITIKVNEDDERIYGLDRVMYSSRIYCTEGPLDSLFIPNCIAVSGSSFNTPIINSLKTNLTLIYDNEPRSPELNKLIAKMIDSDFSVCMWPDTFKYKDINEAVIGGMDTSEILQIINENTFQGAGARLRYATWRRC